MDLEGIILSERQRQILYDLIYMWNVKKRKKGKASPLSHCKPIPNSQEKIRVVVIKGTNFNCTINKY